MSRQVVEIANPRGPGETHTSMARALDYCNRGLAKLTQDGKLEFQRQSSGTFSDQVTWWNGARSQYVNGVNLSAFEPGHNVAYPKPWSKRALRRQAETFSGITKNHQEPQNPNETLCLLCRARCSSQVRLTSHMQIVHQSTTR